MTFEQFWTMIVKRWKLIVICFVVVGLGAFIGSKLMTPRFQSSVLVQVAIKSSNNQADYNSLLASDQLVQTEAQLAISDPVLREVASHYTGLTVQQLTAEVTSAAKTSTQLFEIDVLDSSPTRAAKLANDVANTLIKQQAQQTLQANVQSQQQLQQDLDSTQQQIDNTSSKIAGLQNKPGSQGQLVALRSQLGGLQQHYSQWQTALAQLELTQAQSGSFLHIVQPAQPALKAAQPNILFNTAGGLLAGLLLGFLLAVLFTQLDTHVRTAEDISALLGWSVLGTVWRSRSSDRQETINPQGHDSNAESYRILRTNVGFSGIDAPLRTLMVTSAMPGDGKSTVAANLAIFMAKAGKNTLLVDADLRRPTQHQIFNLSTDKRGLSNAVLMYSMPAAASSAVPSQFVVPTSPARSGGSLGVGQVGLEQCIHSVGIPNLRVMPSGPLPPNPSELLDSKAMQRLQEALALCGAEVIIFDTPPTRGLSDASIIAPQVDGVLVVVDINRASKKHLQEVKAVYTQAGAHVLGCIVNKQRTNRHDTSYSYYYYRHDNSATPGNNNHKATTHVADEQTSVMQAAGNKVKVALANGKKGGHVQHGK
jgi:Mrp family chromosome partitioning ATPase/capsular polysaccharide biosynthesis protein